MKKKIGNILFVGNGHTHDLDTEGDDCTVKYLGNTYNLSEFERAPSSMKSAIDGWLAETYFCGIGIKFSNDDCGIVTMCRWMSVPD